MAEFAFQFWERVDYLRGSMTLAEMAQKTGIKHSLLRNLRTDNRYPKTEDSSKIAKCLNTTIDYLIYGISIQDANQTEALSIQAKYVQEHPEINNLINLIMKNPKLLDNIMAIIGNN